MVASNAPVQLFATSPRLSPKGLVAFRALSATLLLGHQVAHAAYWATMFGGKSWFYLLYITHWTMNLDSKPLSLGPGRSFGLGTAQTNQHNENHSHTFICLNKKQAANLAQNLARNVQSTRTLIGTSRKMPRSKWSACALWCVHWFAGCAPFW
ncbi:unnamed protein product [Durusdinium trenchii]|uniref:Uncharacterized protein n=1 Tax=Durusdinium trenchii TaxID=1381693 RepID=A0ABP0KMS9_9DINO